MAARPGLVPPVDLTDDDLVARFRDGDLRALETLVQRHRRLVRAKARGYFLIGADFDDLEQEGMIGLYKAVRDYRSDRESSFRAFAELCVTRQILTAVKTATRQKHQPLNRYVSLCGMQGGGDAGERHMEELLDEHHGGDPADEVVRSEEMSDIRSSLTRRLTALEVDVLRLHVDGRSYQEIAEELGRQSKAIDNALQRVRRKLEEEVGPARSRPVAIPA